jgi:hypothetical protein
LSYEQLCQQIYGFDEGIPQCRSCPVSGGKVLGCYKYISYPVDAHFEQILFKFFLSQLPTKDSICDQIYRDVVSRVPSSGTSWHTQRGVSRPGMLAALERPLEYKWGSTFSRKKLDSAQILGSLFIDLESPALVVGYVTFWTEFLNFAAGNQSEPSRTIDEVREAMTMFMPISAMSMLNGAVVYVEA